MCFVNCSTTSFWNSCRTIWLRSSGTSNLLCYLGRQFVPVPAAPQRGTERLRGVLPPLLAAAARRKEGCRLLTRTGLAWSPWGIPRLPALKLLNFCMVSHWYHTLSLGAKTPACAERYLKIQLQLKRDKAVPWLLKVFSGNVVVSWHIKHQVFPFLAVYCFSDIWLIRSTASWASVLTKCCSPPQTV